MDEAQSPPAVSSFSPGNRVAQVRRYTRPYGEGAVLIEPILRGVQKSAPFGFGRCIIEPGGRLPLHSHDEHEAWVITRGHGALTYEGVESAIACGDIVFFESGAEHEFTNSSDETLELVSVYWPGA